jgi:hypothetical protein
MTTRRGPGLLSFTCLFFPVPCRGRCVDAIVCETSYGPDDIRVTLASAAELHAAGARHVVVAARWDLLTVEFVAAMTDADILADVSNSTTVASPDHPED